MSTKVYAVSENNHVYRQLSTLLFRRKTLMASYSEFWGR